MRTFKIMSRRERRKGVKKNITRKGQDVFIDRMSGHDFSGYVGCPFLRWNSHQLFGDIPF
jgi:hypothetical protein